MILPELNKKSAEIFIPLSIFLFSIQDQKTISVEKNPSFKFFYIFIAFAFVLSSVINGGIQFGNNRMYLSESNFNHINKHYEKLTLCFIVCNDFCVINELRISGRHFQSWCMGRDISGGSSYWVDHFFNKQTFRKKVT